MKVVYDNRYKTVYSSDPASAPGRIESIYEKLQDNFEFVEPKPAKEEDILLVHSQHHIDLVKAHPLVYETALLAAGGAIKASEIAMQGEPAFGLIRPPGHHASRDSSWGFCYFNNIAVAIGRLIHARKINRALIVDFDLHFGDGTNNTFAGNPNVVYHHMGQDSKNLEKFLSTTDNFDMLAVSAGFDRGIADWGGTLTDEDYEQIGRLLKEFSQVKSQRRRFAVLEGGYNHTTLGRTMSSFMRTFA